VSQFYFRLIQELNVVILASGEYADGNFDPPPFDPITGEPRVSDPSSSSTQPNWGTNPVHGSTGTGADPDPQTRSPGGPVGGDGQPGAPKRHRKGGTARRPLKNILTHADATPGPRRCFSGILTVEVTNPAPDFGGWNGTRPALFGTLCAPYNPPALPGPTTAFVMRSTQTITLGLGGSSPPNTLLPDVIATHLTLNVGSSSFATVIDDRYAGPGSVCTSSSGTGGCTGPTVTTSGPPNGTANGVVISPA
jgi:hypothetical protein